MWRYPFFTLLVLVLAKSSSAAFLHSEQLLALVRLGLRFMVLPLSMFVINGAVAIVRTEASARGPLIRKRWLHVLSYALDRSLLFMVTILFFVMLPPIKLALPAGNGFWADQYLIAFDYWLFGTEPWRLSHALLGPMTPVLDGIYNAWIVMVVLISLGLALLAGEQLLARFYMGLALIWTVLAIGLAGLIVSAGPLFGPELGLGFQPLIAELERSAPLTLASKAYLWEAHTTGIIKLGGGISAAPSIHCAISFLFAFAAWRSRFFPLALAYALIIWIGSVHLGWHYFADGLISLVGVALLWPVCVWCAGWRRPSWLGWSAQHPCSDPVRKDRLSFPLQY